MEIESVATMQPNQTAMLNVQTGGWYTNSRPSTVTILSIAWGSCHHTAQIITEDEPGNGHAVIKTRAVEENAPPFTVICCSDSCTGGRFPCPLPRARLLHQGPKGGTSGSASLPTVSECALHPNLLIGFQMNHQLNVLAIILDRGKGGEGVYISNPVLSG